MTTIKVTEAVPGMILNNDVYLPNTNIIALSSGTILSKANIKRLKDLNIDTIRILVKSKNTDNKIERDIFFENYKRLKNKLEILFNKVKMGEKILISELNDEADDMIKSLSQNNNILTRLRSLSNNGVYLNNHSIHVSLLSASMGKLLGYSDKRLKELLIAGIFHDIGMLKVPQNILDKPGPLSEEEFIVIINHTINGYKILKDISDIKTDIAYGALEHHEREDGSGYPLGLKSNEIHEFGKIMAISDIFDAMTTDKIYKKKKSPFIAVEEILYNSYGVLDGEITTLFLNNISQFYIGNIVKLNDGSVGEIAYINKAIPTRPIININGEFVDLLKNNKYKIVDIID